MDRFIEYQLLNEEIDQKVIELDKLKTEKEDAINKSIEYISEPLYRSNLKAYEKTFKYIICVGILLTLLWYNNIILLSVFLVSCLGLGVIVRSKVSMLKNIIPKEHKGLSDENLIEKAKNEFDKSVDLSREIDIKLKEINNLERKKELLEELVFGGSMISAYLKLEREKEETEDLEKQEYQENQRLDENLEEVVSNEEEPPKVKARIRTMY